MVFLFPANEEPSHDHFHFDVAYAVRDPKHLMTGVDELSLSFTAHEMV
jgi:hypothetical protein